ncbi:S-layer homology domain-containing protein [Paenibacillus sp. N1-5-1-14]|uniref:S-layer homology domain-containing protein n=1 Tax=Paenibacillus radicibacter TaxID=2972488 RepID=UPI0021590CCF|nr:S-layer homology domain-containing protein [Paenibacillus radicibacter]MCR8644673.1 S-layer homology domain-containing protein [Paenibacillus radicibacter]
MKKLLLGATAFAMFATAAPTATYAAVKEEEPVTDPRLEYFAKDMMNHWATPTMIDLVQADVLKGYEENGERFIKPEGKVTRAEFVAILLRAADVKVEASENKFEDAKKGDWFYETVATAHKLGIVAGKTETEFAPNASITRAEVSAILNRFFEKTIKFDGETVAFNDIAEHWAKKDIENMSKAGVVAGYGKEFKPQNDATRAEAASLIQRALHKEQNTLPEAEMLAKKAEAVVNQLKTVAESEDLAAGEKFFTEETMGYEAANGKVMIAMLKALFEEKLKMEVTFTGTPKFEVAFASDRYASVKVSGLDAEMKIGEGETAITQKINMDDTLKFRHVNGVWKLYGSVDSYQQSADDLFEEAEVEAAE